MHTYADDTTLIVTAATPQDLQKLAQTELNNLIRYFHTNNLVPNPTKTTYTIFSGSQQQIIELAIGDHLLEHTQKAKLLGMYIQHNLKHYATINNITRKLQRAIQALRYATTLLNAEYMLRLYYIHVYPHLTGAISIWGTQDGAQEYIKPLIRTHKKIVRILANVPPRTTTAPIMQKLKILNIPNLYTLRVCAEMHPYIYPDEKDRCQNNRPHHNHKYIAITDVHSHNTRYSKGHIFSPNTNKYSKFRQPEHTNAHLTEIHAKIWNELPEYLRKIESLQIFKSTLKEHLLRAQKQQHNIERTHGHHLA